MKFFLILISMFLMSTQTIVAQVQDTFYSNPNTKPRPKSDKPAYDLPDPLPYGNTIRANDMQELITFLASDSLKGRETGQPGQRYAADFIATCMQDAGLPPRGDRGTYFQQIHLERTSWKDIGVTVDGKAFKNKEDFYVYPTYIKSTPLIKVKDIVFVGYGIEDTKYNDYGKTDVSGKTVVFYDGEPMGKTSGVSLISGTTNRSEWALGWKKKVELAKSKGAELVLIIDPMLSENLQKNRKLISTYGWVPVDNQLNRSDKIANTLFISEAMAAAIMGDKSNKVKENMEALKSGAGFKPVKLKSKLEVRLDKELTQLDGSNVVGFIEGSDPVLKNEYVFVTAHYDHLGHTDDRIFYGADDNASGTAGVIEIARAFAAASKGGFAPKRSVVCMLVSGEEKGLLGSKFYVDFPLFSLKKTVVEINIDMIGRVDAAHKDGNYIYVIGADRLSTELHEIQERNNRVYTKMDLDYKYNDPNDPNHYYERSDHYNFAERGIPSVFYFNGTHPDYHKTTDTVEKINFEAAAKRAQLAFYTAWEIANRPTAPVVDKK